MARNIELMAPVSDFVSLRAALQGGANAIYFGVKELNLRATVRNFELNQLKKVVSESKKK
jgi:putative protease